MNFKKHIIYIVIVILSSCSKELNLQSYNSETIGVNISPDSTILNIIAPYKKAIQFEMNEVISYSKTNLTKKGNESLLGNFVTDLCLHYADAHMCVMNNGGLRTSINKGDITRGKIYELMPFENELVILRLNKKDYIGLLEYICRRGGEPFSGIKITMNKKREIINHSWPVNFEQGEYINVLTSDYLANGGDKMSFFKNKEQIKVGIKLRDAIIDYCTKTDTINVQIDGRLKIIEDEK